MRTFYIILISLFLSSCLTDPPYQELKTHVTVKHGTWRVELDLGDEILPFNLKIQENYNGKPIIKILNAEEIIDVNEVKINGDSLFFETPLYSSKFKGKIIDSEYITGTWHNYEKAPDYIIPFTAEYGETNRFIVKENPTAELKNKYQIEFSPNKSESAYNAIGLFQIKDNNRVYGTFLTETGDYRYLEGVVSSNNLMLSCFDGSHAFLFKGDIKGDSIINGEFYSGNHYKDHFIGVVNNSYELTNPNSITKLVNKNHWHNTQVKNINNKTLSLSELGLQNKVTIIQIMGSWCPNCIDESRYYKDLHAKYNIFGLEIIGVAFESEKVGFNGIKRIKKQLNLPYDLFLGGIKTKNAAKNTFPMLDNISSFPTSLIIDRKGNIRKIHTGFYGPGTGEYYNQYKKEIDLFVKKLIEEPIN